MSATEQDVSWKELTADSRLDLGGQPEEESQPKVVKFEEVSAAAFKVRGGVERTPCNVS